MLLEFTPTMTPAGQVAIVHCMKEANPYPGINIDISNNNRRVVVPNNKQIYTGSVATVNYPIQYALVKQGKIFTLYDNIGTVLGSVENESDITPIDQTLLLGAYQTVDGVKGRFFKGTIHAFSISDTVYNNEQINAYLGIVISQGRVFKIDSTCMNTTGNKLTDSIANIEATLGGAPTVSNNQIVFTENDNFSFDISSLNLTTKGRTFRVKFTPTTLDDTTKCVCTIGASATSWSQQTSSYITNTNLIIQHGDSAINNITVGSTNGNTTDNRLSEAPVINTEYEIVISENASTNKIRWFVNGTLVQDGTVTLYNPLFLGNGEGSGRFIGSYSLIEIYDVFCDTYEDFNNIKDK